MINDLDLTWERGFRRVQLESDSREAINLAKSGCSTNHPLKNLIVMLMERINQRWEDILQPSYIESNAAAHWLAVAAHVVGVDMMILNEPPELKHVLRCDLGLGTRP